RETAVFVPALEGVPRVELEARAAGAAIASPARRLLQPELAAAEAARLIEDETFRAGRTAGALAEARAASFAALAARVEGIYGSIASRRRALPPRPPLEDRDWIVADLHLPTTWSPDRSIEVDDLLA